MNPFFFARYTVSAQSEGWAFFWLRVNDCHIGFILPPKLWAREAYCKLPAWYRAARNLLPLLRLDFWAHTHQLDQRWVFRAYLFGFSIGWLTTGETNQPGFSDRASGLVLRRGLYGF